MSKFNISIARPAGRGPLHTEATAAGTTHEGGAGYARDPKSELFIRATASFAGQDAFYEDATNRDNRLTDLVAGLATTEDGFTWLQGFLPWLRRDASMRTAPLMLAAETVRARLEAGQYGSNRQLISTVLNRADEPGELLAYWTSRYGRAIPKPVKRGIADAVTRLYTSARFSATTATAADSGSATSSTSSTRPQLRRRLRGRATCSAGRSPHGTIETRPPPASSPRSPRAVRSARSIRRRARAGGPGTQR